VVLWRLATGPGGSVTSCDEMTADSEDFAVRRFFQIEFVGVISM
jgi:hypothetical protein